MQAYRQDAPSSTAVRVGALTGFEPASRRERNAGTRTAAAEFVNSYLQDELWRATEVSHNMRTKDMTMDATHLLFAVFLFLAVFNAGTMTTLQIQHYGVYPLVGREAFAAYMRAQNRAARVPAVAPGILLLLASAALMVQRPAFMSTTEAAAALVLNLIALVSTFSWQRPIQARLAEAGYDERQVRRLLATNWVRTAAFFIQGVLATGIAVFPEGRG